MVNASISSQEFHIIFKLIRLSVFGLLSAMEGFKEAVPRAYTPQWDY